MSVGELIEIILYVEDMNGQVAFYRDTLGLKVAFPTAVKDYGKESWVTLHTGACVLALHSGGKRRLGQDAPKIVFRVSEVAGVRNALIQKGVPMDEVRSPAPGVLVSDGTDPEGNKLSIESQE